MSSGGVPSTKNVVPRLDYLMYFTASLRWVFSFDFYIALSYIIKELSLSGGGRFGSICGNPSLPLIPDFIALDLAFPDAIGPIYCTSTMREMFTLNGFSIDYTTKIPLRSSSLFGIFTCFG